MDLQRKIGPLPMWAWALLVGGVAYVVYRRYSAGSSSSTSATTASTLDPNSVDPNTGLTYGQEEQAALNANAASLGGGSALGGGTSESGAQGTLGSGPNFLSPGDILSFLTQWQQLVGSPGTQPPVSNSGTASGSGASGITTPSNPPTSSASSHTNPNLTAGQISTVLRTAVGSAGAAAGNALTGANAASFLKGLTSGGYKLRPGTSHGGGTGTYVKPGSNTVYFAYNQGGQLHVRQASQKAA